MSGLIDANRVGPVQWELLGQLSDVDQGVYVMGPVMATLRGRYDSRVVRAAANMLVDRGLIVHLCCSPGSTVVRDCQVAITAKGLTARIRGGGVRYGHACALMRRGKR